MSYSGEVEVGGSADTREAGDLVITKVAVGPMSNNAYLLRCAITGEQAMIDAAAEPDTLLALVGDAGLARVVTTHRHPDHWQALSAVVDATGAETVASPVDAEEIPVPTTNPVTDGARVRVGSCELEVIGLVGHTPGSIALAYDDPDGIVHLFTGDSLFPGGVGKTTFPRGLRLSHRRRRVQAVRPFRGRHLVLPRPRERLHDRCRTAVPSRVAGTRLVVALRGS